MKVPKEIKDHLEKLPVHLRALAHHALELADQLSGSAEGIQKEVEKLEVEE